MDITSIIISRKRRFVDIRTAGLEDLDFLEKLENISFKSGRRSSRKSLRHSILSPHQFVYIAHEGARNCGALFLLLYKKQIRIYSIAVLGECRGEGVGTRLVEHAVFLAEQFGMRRITLEAELGNTALVHWYESLGFESTRVIVDYYAKNEDAVRMTLFLTGSQRQSSVVVTDFDTDFFKGIPNIVNIRANTYIEETYYQQTKNLRVFNLCSSLGYQSVGYYVSLLAQARNHVVFPNTTSLMDFRSNVLVRSIGEEIFELIQKELADEQKDVLTIESWFGRCPEHRYQNLINALSSLYEAPLLCWRFEKKDYWTLKKVSAIKLKDIEDSETVKKFAVEYFLQKRFAKSTLNNYKYDMAMLTDENEKNPPSCAHALAKFKSAAESLGFYVETIGKKDYKRITEFDALFIRTTTNVNNYTYDFSRYAYSEGLVVIDDPWSILRCSNKLYLFESLRAAGIKMPKTWTLNKKSGYKKQMKALKYPIILKQPDSAFSIGVYKVADENECMNRLAELFKKSEIVIAQEYLPTDYDWRIGIIDKKPLFACKYYMAKNHWQIYNWSSEDKDAEEGGFETLPLSFVPEKVVHTAVDAANLIGDGLYGVDLKEIGGEAYVIEVNDNPSIDNGIEDKYLGDELYRRVMESFFARLENARQIIRPVS